MHFVLWLTAPLGGVPWWEWKRCVKDREDCRRHEEKRQKEITMQKPEGDDYLCGLELKLWSLVQEILFRWNTLVIFRWDRLDARYQTPGMIRFFVPHDATHRYEIVKFLDYELEREKLKAGMDLPGRNVEICDTMTFGGIEPYLPRDKSEAMAREFAKIFIPRVKNELDKDTIFSRKLWSGWDSYPKGW